jgi:hypothetical protein
VSNVLKELNDAYENVLNQYIRLNWYLLLKEVNVNLKVIFC